MIVASITTSLDGYVTGPDDRPGAGLGRGGERLHHWVFGGPWTYDGERSAEGMSGADLEHHDALVARTGSEVVGRGMHDAAGAWGGTNPWAAPAFVVTHQVEDQPHESAGFRFVDGVEEAVAQAREVAGDRDVSIGGGASVVRQALDAGLVDELASSTAPLVLGAGKRGVGGLHEGPRPGAARRPPLGVRRAHQVRRQWRSSRPTASVSRR